MDSQHLEQTKRIEGDLRELGKRFDRHLEIYASNGKELAAVKVEMNNLVKGIDELKHTIDESHKELKDRFVTKDTFSFYKRLTWMIIGTVVTVLTSGGLLAASKFIN